MQPYRDNIKNNDLIAHFYSVPHFAAKLESLSTKNG